MKPQFLLITLILFLTINMLNINNSYCKNIKKNSLKNFLKVNSIKAEQIIIISNWSDFQEKIINKKSSYFVCFYKGDNHLSKKFTEVLKEVLSKHLNTKVAFVDVNITADIAKIYQIGFTPILKFFKNGDILDDKVF